MSALVDLGGDRVKWTLWKFYLTAHLRGFHVPAGVFFTKRKICLFWLYRQKHFRGIMMYRLMPRLLPRPNMNFYLAWKRRSIQKWVSAIYYYCVQRKKHSCKLLRKVLQKLLPNDPVRACSLCCTALHWTVDQRSLLVWPQKMTAVPCLTLLSFSLARLGRLNVTVERWGLLCWKHVGEGSPSTSLQCCYSYGNCMCWSTAISAWRSFQECPPRSASACCSSYS